MGCSLMGCSLVGCSLVGWCTIGPKSCEAISIVTRQQFDAPSVCDVSAEFGYYPDFFDGANEIFSIQTKRDHESIVNSVIDDPNVLEDWIYPGAQRQLEIVSGHVCQRPYNTRVFGLPKTHVLTLHKTEDRGDLDFVVWCLSFFVGMRLTTTDAGFFDATPIKPGKLVDFVLSSCALSDVVQLALNYLKSERESPLAPKRVEAVIHALFLAQYPHNLPFEQFQYLYMALDACFSLIKAKESKPPRLKHAERIDWMCNKFGLPVPDWVDSNRDGGVGVGLSSVRNYAFHEALFFGQPLGFAVSGDGQSSVSWSDVALQMRALICRLLIAILGDPGNDYVRKSVNTRQRYRLKLSS